MYAIHIFTQTYLKLRKHFKNKFWSLLPAKYNSAQLFQEEDLDTQRFSKPFSVLNIKVPFKFIYKVLLAAATNVSYLHHPKL